MSQLKVLIANLSLRQRILIVAAAAFCGNGPPVTELQDAAGLLKYALGSTLAPVAFAIGLLCAGQSSTVTGTLAGQITMEGFLNLRIRPWLRRLATRLLAIVPAIVVIALAGRGEGGAAAGGGEQAGVYQLLIFSQVVLSLQLPFAVVPLVRFTGSRTKMGPFVNRPWVQALAWLVTAGIVALNGKLVYEQIADWSRSAGGYGWLVAAAAGTVAALLAASGVRCAAFRQRGEPVVADVDLK